MTNAFILNWNPSKWHWPADDHNRKIRQTESGQVATEPWSVGARKRGISIGDRAYLLRQHSHRGLIGSGSFTSEIYEDGHWDGTGRTTTYADIEWDVLVHTEDRLPVEVLKAVVAEITWDRLQGSGVQVHEPAAGRLDELWSEHVGGIEHRIPDEIEEGTHTEGATSKVTVNRYERDRRARQCCIEHWGTTCQICGFDFGATYGEIGDGYIHVHHLIEISTVGETYIIDPVEDLRPVCPNCHAMLHTRRPALTIQELQELLSG